MAIWISKEVIQLKIPLLNQQRTYQTKKGQMDHHEKTKQKATPSFISPGTKVLAVP